MTAGDRHRRAAARLEDPRHRMVSLAFAMIGTLALGACTSSLAAPPRPDRSRSTDAALERDVLDLVNRHRTGRDLPPLTFDARIAREARRHSAAMAAGSTPFGHGGFDDRFATLRRTVSCRHSAENVASNRGYRDPASEAVRAWLGSRGHRRNLEGPYESTGIGVARSASGELYFTQFFCRR